MDCEHIYILWERLALVLYMEIGIFFWGVCVWVLLK